MVESFHTERRVCPYHYCGATVQINVINGEGIIKEHEINHRALTGTCPASLMHWPLNEESARHLAHRLLEDRRRVTEWQRQERERDHGRDLRAGGPNRSQSLRQPGRMGREPSPKSPDWALGGRADEDVVPATEQRTGKLPPGVEGIPLGSRGGGNGMNADELAARVSSAGMTVQEAIQAINQAKEKVAMAKGIIAEVGGENPGQTIQDYLGGLGRAQTEMEQVISDLNWSVDKGQQYIQNLYS